MSAALTREDAAAPAGVRGRRGRGRVPHRHRLRALLRPRGRARPSQRLYELKGAPAGAPARGHVLRARARAAALPELDASAERAALAALLPGPVTLLLRQPPRGASRSPARRRRRHARPARARCLERRWRRSRRCACPVLQSSANLSGEPDARRLEEVPDSAAARAPTSCSTAASCRACPRRSSTCATTSSSGAGSVLREGALARDSVQASAPLSAPSRAARRRRRVAARLLASWQLPRLAPEVESTTGKRPANPPRAWASESSSPAQGERRVRAEPRLLQPPPRRGGSRDRRGAARRARAPAGHARDDRLGELRAARRARVPGLGAHEQVRRGLSGRAATTAAASGSTSPSSSRSTAPRRCSAPSTPTSSRTPARRPTPPSTTRCLQPGDTIMGLSLAHGGPPHPRHEASTCPGGCTTSSPTRSTARAA